MYVITGATGNTGRVVVETLLAKGQPVRVIGRSAERLQPFVHRGAEPFVGRVEDEAVMTRAFQGAKAVYAMIPPDMTLPDFRGYQDRVSSALAGAIQTAAVRYAVALSSMGADKPDRTGPVVGLHNFEQKLNGISQLNVLHLRAGYFMENLLSQIGLIQRMGLMAGPLRRELPLPMIATRDIGAYAGDRLLRLNFSSQQTRELLGERDVTMAQAAGIIGKVIGKPNLTYEQVSDDMAIAGMTQMGIAVGTAKLLVEMSAALNSGYMAPLEKRSPENTTPTSIETFAKEEFAPRFQAKSAKA